MPPAPRESARRPSPTGWRIKWIGDAFREYSDEELDRDDFDWEALDAADAQRWSDYQVHLAALLPELPPGLSCFRVGGEGDWVTTHDAWVEWWSDASPDAFTVQLICCTPTGVVKGSRALARYERVVVHYTGRVVLTGAPRDQVHGWLDDAQTAVLRDELDRAPDGGFEQRFRLWPDGEFGVAFDDAVVVRAPVEPSAWKAVVDRRVRERERSWRVVSRGYDAAAAVAKLGRFHLSNAHFEIQQRLGRR